MTFRILFLAMMTLLATVAEGKEAAIPSVTLPPPDVVGAKSLEEVLAQRRSVQEYIPGAVTIKEISQLLWAAQGKTAPERRTAPSAGAKYPLELHLLVKNVGGLAAGHYRYEQSQHRLDVVSRGSLHQQLAAAAMSQRWLEQAAAVVVITAVFERTTKRYGKRGERYVYIETGHAAQNLLLQAVAAGLCARPVGSFNDTQLSRLLKLPEREMPLYLIPVGKCVR